MLKLGLGISLSRLSALINGYPSIVYPQVIDTEDYELAIVVDPDGGTFTLSISVGGVPVSGSPFTVTPEQLSANEHCLRDVVISGDGSPAVGETLTATSGLWIVDPTLSLSISRQWYRGANPISGAIGLTYTLDSADSGQSITCREVVGSTTIISNALNVATSIVVKQDFSGTPSFLLTATDGGYNSGTKTRTLNVTGTNLFASWAINMVSGKTYRVRGNLAGTANVVFRFDEELNLNTTPYIDSRTINSGDVDFSFVYSGATATRYCGLRSVPSAPVTLQLVDFRVEEL